MSAATTSGTLLRGLLAADREDRSLISGPAAATAVEQIAIAAERRGCEFVLGASDAGQRLAGALFVTHPGRFRQWAPGASAPVMVVDGVALGDAALRRSMRFVRSAGASAAFGVRIALTEFRSTPPSEDVDVLDPVAS